MNTDKQTKPWLRLCTGALAAGGVALSTLGLTSGVAQAAPPPAPAYHWCPGDAWDQAWGPYPNWNACRDWDGNYWGSAGYPPPGYGPGYGPPQPYGPPPPPPGW
jgi:hypothetical protein